MICGGRSFTFRLVLSGGCYGGADGCANGYGCGCESMFVALGGLSVGLLKTLYKSHLIFVKIKFGSVGGYRIDGKSSIIKKKKKRNM